MRFPEADMFYTSFIVVSRVWVSQSEISESWRDLYFIKLCKGEGPIKLTMCVTTMRTMFEESTTNGPQGIQVPEQLCVGRLMTAQTKLSLPIYNKDEF